jgi:two-component system, chemotaxis family, sensor kinase CheA
MTLGAADEELTQLFAQEASTRIARLSEQLLQLEQTPNDPELVASLFREAHTIKGSAFVVGFNDVGRVAHALEDVLERLRSGDRIAGSDLIDGLLKATDELGDMIQAAVRGEDHGALSATLVTRLTRGDLWGSSPTEGRGEERLPPAQPPASLSAPAEESTQYEAPSARIDGVLRVRVSRVDEIVRLVGEAAAANLRVGRRLAELTGAEAASVADYRDLSTVLNELQEKSMRARMVPVATVTESLHRAVRDVARKLDKNVRWEVRGEDTEMDRNVLEQLADPLLHLVRNAVDHGVEPAAERAAAGKSEQAVVRLHAMQIGSEVIIAISDDGRGIDVERVRAQAGPQAGKGLPAGDAEALYLVFRSGLSTAPFVSDISGRGVGLDVVRSSLDAIRGRIEVRSEWGHGSEFRIAAPITLAVLPCLIVCAGGERYAMPMHSVVRIVGADGAIADTGGGRPVMWLDDQPFAVSDMGRALGSETECRGPVLLLSAITRRHAFRVDQLVGQRDVLVKGLGGLLPRFGTLAGVSVEPDGSILLVLDANGLIDAGRRDRFPSRAVVPHVEESAVRADGARARLLVVDDALTVRELQRSILERAGYDVRTASDGQEALARLSEGPCDLVLTDVEMPRMDGFSLTEAIRAQPGLANMAIIILTSRASETDKRRGLEAGADGYIVKSAFDETSLLAAVERLLGRSA